MSVVWGGRTGCSAHVATLARGRYMRSRTAWLCHDCSLFLDFSREAYLFSASNMKECVSDVNIVVCRGFHPGRCDQGTYSTFTHTLNTKAWSSIAFMDPSPVTYVLEVQDYAGASMILGL